MFDPQDRYATCPITGSTKPPPRWTEREGGTATLPHHYDVISVTTITPTQCLCTFTTWSGYRHTNIDTDQAPIYIYIQYYIYIQTRVCCSLGVHSSVRVMHIRLPEQPVGLGARRVGGGVASSPPRPPRVLQIHAERHAHLCACVCMCMYMCVCVCKREREKERGGSMFVSWGGRHYGL